MDILSDRTKREIQLRLGHFLVGYRNNRGLTQEEMATRLGYSLSQYKRMELGLEGRISNSIEFIAEFAQLAQKTVPEFVQYLENTPIETRANLAENEVKLLSAFGNIPFESRRNFIKNYCNGNNEKLAALIDISILLKNLSPAQLLIIQIFLSSIYIENSKEIDSQGAINLVDKILSILTAFKTSIETGVMKFPDNN